MCCLDCTARTRSHPDQPRELRAREAPPWLRCTLAALLGSLLILLSASTAPASEATRGLPFIRRYAFEDIGNVSRGSRLGFDPFGRLAIIQDGTYAVLNDTTWLDIADRDDGAPRMINVIRGADGRSYYGAYGSWGVAELSRDGRMRALPRVAPDAPPWTTSTNFADLLSTPDGIYLSGFDGVVFFDPASGRGEYFETPGVSRMFKVGRRVYVSCHQQSIQFVDIARGVLERIEGTDFGGIAVDQGMPLDEEHSLLATRDGRLYVFDGRTPVPWPAQARFGISGRVFAMKRLPEGAMALAVNGKGLYLISPDGELELSLSSPEYQNVTGLACREPGVLWVATETGVEKILYGSPVSRFGQSLGLPVSWPQVARWRGRIIVVSGGRLYEPVPGSVGGATRFRAMPHQPIAGAWGIATDGERLLIGNSSGAFAATGDGLFVPVLTDIDVARLVMAENGVCYVLGPKEIGALRWTGDRWVECAPRVEGVGYPSIVHRAGNSAWIELGPNRAARVALHGDRIDVKRFESFPWKEPHWINIGMVDDTVVLAGPPEGRIFFDEKTEQLCQPPALSRLLEQAPYYVERVRRSEDGTLWASHEHGIMTIRQGKDGPVYDTATYDIIDDRAPLVQLLPEGDVWISTGYSLYHVDRRSAPETKTSFAPVLVSAVNARGNREAFFGPKPMDSLQRIPFEANNLSFRFFAGSYASYRSPVYEFRLNQNEDKWSSIGTGSLLSFPELHQGRYHLEVRVRDNHGPFGLPTALEFQILPPWYRTAYAYVFYALGAILALYGLVRWSSHRAQARNVVLEKLVEDRTNELRVTMRKLNEETRNAATLAERDRLACEIHDSLQQGLSGLILQLDATLKLAGLTPDVRSRLTVARNMVSFTRHEVQHAVWDMESPLLEGTELEEALQKITALISPGAIRIEVSKTGEPVPLSSEAKHHLLRIGQEAITNAVRHARARTLRIQVDYRADTVVLTVVDDGCGFDPEEVLVNGLGHFGLRGVRGRAAKIGAELHIDSTPGRGTTVRIVAPTAQPPSNPPVSHAASHANG